MTQLVLSKPPKGKQPNYIQIRQSLICLRNLTVHIPLFSRKIIVIDRQSLPEVFFLFQSDRAEGVVGVGLYKLDSVHLKLRWRSVTSRLSCEQKIGDCEKSNFKLN